jgi:hypothetical protein
MGWLSWSKNPGSKGGEGTSKSVPASKSRSGNAETHHLNSAGGSKQDHSHVIVQHKGSGRSSAHALPHKSKRS